MNFHQYGVVCEAVVVVVEGCHHGVLLLLLLGVVLGVVEGRHHGVLLLLVVVSDGGVDVRKLNKYKIVDWSVLEVVTVDLHRQRSGGQWGTGWEQEISQNWAM